MGWWVVRRVSWLLLVLCEDPPARPVVTVAPVRRLQHRVLPEVLPKHVLEGAQHAEHSLHIQDLTMAD